MDHDTDNETLAVTMAIPLRLVHYFDPGKIVELTLPDRRGDYFRVDSASWSGSPHRYALSLTWQNPRTIAPGISIPSFRIEHARADV